MEMNNKNIIRCMYLACYLMALMDEGDLPKDGREVPDRTLLDLIARDQKFIEADVKIKESLDKIIR